MFATGMVFFYKKSYLALLCLSFFCFFRPRWTLLTAFLCANLFGLIHQWWVADRNIPQVAVINGAYLSGTVASIPIQQSDKLKFEFHIDHLNEKTLDMRILLTCYQHCPKIHADEQWLVRAKLRKIHNLNNPGGFDYKTLMAAHHIEWTGYAVGQSFQKINNANPNSLLVVRERLASYLATFMTEEKTLGIVQALTLGVTNHISQDLWALFRRTGTTHLMVISGAHIGLVAGMIFQLIRLLLVRFQHVCLRYPTPKIASIVAILTGFSYAFLAGFGAPAERSAVASFFIFIRQVGQKKFGVWQAWRYALLIVLLTEPHAVLMPGFYLSFIAVAILLTMNQRIKTSGWRKGLLLQLSCLFGLLPFTLYWFSYGALNGFIANLLAIPLVSFVVVPLSLLTLLFGAKLTWLVMFLKMTIAILLHYLNWIDGLASINFTKSYLSIALPLLGMTALLLCVCLPLKGIIPTAIAMLFTVIYPARLHIKMGEFQVAVMDVGQGSAALIRTHNHAILYDTGGQIYRGADMGQLVVIPYLQILGIQRLDQIIISHPDLDHRGGLRSLEAQYPIGELIVDDPGFYHRGLSCHDYPEWNWEGIQFKFFPINHLKLSKNNRSCVLQVSNHAGKILLVGDIEREAEHYLIEKYGKSLQSTILMVPHHGSKTSSTLSFVQQVAPSHAVISYGFDNRYHFPHEQILATYQQQGIKLYTTAELGMITFMFHQNRLSISSFLQ